MCRYQTLKVMRKRWMAHGFRQRDEHGFGSLQNPDAELLVKARPLRNRMRSGLSAMPATASNLQAWSTQRTEQQKRRPVGRLDFSNKPRYAPGSDHSSLFGWLLLADHVGLERRKVPTRMKTARLGYGSPVFIYPALFGHRQSIGTAEQVGGLLLVFGKQGVQHGGEALAAEVGGCEARFLGGGLGEVQAEGRWRADHAFSMQGLGRTAPAVWLSG